MGMRPVRIGRHGYRVPAYGFDRVRGYTVSLLLTGAASSPCGRFCAMALPRTVFVDAVFKVTTGPQSFEFHRSVFDAALALRRAEQAHE